MSRLIQYWLRGGSWLFDGNNCRSVYRVLNSPDSRSVYIGFRVVRGGEK